MSIPAAHLILSEPGSGLLQIILPFVPVLIARQALFQSYIMIVIAFAIIMCDSSVRERSVLERINENSHTSAIHRPVDRRGNSQGPPVSVQGGSLEFALNCLAPASFELK